jgi:hypothetical protein
MATIEFSAGLMSGLPARMTSPTTAQVSISNASNDPYIYNMVPLMPYAYWVNSIADWYFYQSFIAIYKGTVPTDFSTLTAYNSRSADVLVSYTVARANNFINSSGFSSNPVIINSLFQTATASGTATWFRLCTYSGTNTTPANLIIHQIVGTIGATGSGADLEMGDVNIVSGKNYKISNLRIQFPSVWNY